MNFKEEIEKQKLKDEYLTIVENYLREKKSKK